LTPFGVNYRIPNPSPIDETYTMTLLASADPRDEVPICVSLRKDTNTAEDFLKAGDYLIVDNAKVHLAQEILDEPLTLQSSTHVNLFSH